MNGAKSQIATFVPAFPDTGPAAESFRPKILLYSHDTFGLGNIHRTLLLSDALRRAFPGAAVLIITGSPVIHALRIPEAIDYLKLPCLDRVAADRYEPRFLSTFAKEVKRMRRAIIRRAALGFDPDMMIVDKRPLGVDGELAGTLSALRRLPHPVRIVLGVRDILDEPTRTRRTFGRTHTFATLEHTRSPRPSPASRSSAAT
ncbi:MAG: hypothetical protein E6J77_26085 [Deltaproteobacteria bacterium]|nr:MAG: hypothetical protein E6J77_26085 [Deltaproteobacteria bacterium]